jgi:hypothetical protein
VWQAGRLLLAVPGSSELTIGSGRRLALTGDALEIELCSGERAGEFYLLRR